MTLKRGEKVTTKPVKIQAYLDVDVHEALQNISDTLGVSTSKAAAKMIAKGIQNYDQEYYQKRNHMMLKHVLTSVYDNKVSEANAETVKKLLNHIEEKTNKSA